MTTRPDGASRIERALREKVGDRANEVMHKRTKYLANLTPFEIAQAPNGDRIVLAELDKIVLQSAMIA